MSTQCKFRNYWSFLNSEILRVINVFSLHHIERELLKILHACLYHMENCISLHNLIRPFLKKVLPFSSKILYMQLLHFNFPWNFACLLYYFEIYILLRQYYQNIFEWSLIDLLSKLFVTLLFSIIFRNQIENQVWSLQAPWSL